jgi:DNA topoisomerase IB
VANYFKIGDPIFFGKYKNKPGKIVRFFKDGRGLPYVEVEPIPKGRKKNREMGLFNIWHQDTAKRATALAHRKMAEMSHAASIALMKWLSQVTQQLGVARHVYVVGGAVRNFLIDQPIKDIDMVVDSLALRGNKDAAWVAQQIARRIPVNTEIVTDNLMVSKVLIKGDWDLDGHPMKGNDIEIVNAREEVYEQDEAGDYLGHKPKEVKPTSLETDVTRREFTFNTLMWSLMSLAKGPDKAEIIDLTGCGLRDLENREMRCPQDPDLTFKQDPTRILRTIKFAFKYGFKLPPDVKAAAKRQAKGLKRIPSKTWSVLQKIVLDNPQYKKALAAMADLGVTDVLAEMMQEDQQFASTMAKYSRNRGVAYMFDLMDVGIPAGSPMGFLSAPQQKVLRQITTPMDRDEAIEFLEVLRNPGRAYKDKQFVPGLARSRGYLGRGMALFMPQVTEIARALLLDEPALATNPTALKSFVSRQVDRIPARTAASKFKNKKQVPKADGKGTLTIYEYSKGQIQHRNRAKAERVEKLRSTIGGLRKQVSKDLTSEDPKVRLAALAVALIDQTYERVGNDKSASENGHYGITTLTTDHVKMGKGKATLSYVGKSGVKHTKTVTDKPTVTALKKAMKGRGKGDRLLCDGVDCTIRARDVNAYLRDFEVTAKDLRGMHANEEVRNRLTQIRKAGPELPRARKERDKILKAEFKEALVSAAEMVGHEASTLKSQYLVPGMETAYLKDGTVIDKLHKAKAKKASLEDKWGPTLTAASLPLQVFLLGMGGGVGAFDENKLPKGKLRITSGGVPDKPKGAFWTSTLKGNSSEWLEWCSWEMPHWIGKQAVLFKPKSSAKILTILSITDYEEVKRAYPGKIERLNKYGDAHIDWEAVAKDYDAATCPTGRCIYAWDAESTAWFNMNALEFERLVDVKEKCSIPDPDEDDSWGPDKQYEFRVGTKSDAEKEDEEAQRLIRNSPKKKPPRKDLERSLITDHKDEDLDEKQDRKDRSLNWKDIAASMQVRRVASRFAAEVAEEDAGGSGGSIGGAFLEFLKEEGDNKVKSPDTGNQVKLKSLKGDKGKKVQQEEFQKWLSKNKDKDKGSAKPKKEKEEGEKSELSERADAAETKRQEEERTQEEATKIVDSLSHLNDTLTGDIGAGDIDEFTPEQQQAFASSFGATSTRMDEGDNGFRTDPGKRKRLEKKVEGFRELLDNTDSDGKKLKKDPEKFAEALATVDYYERVLNNPLVVPNNPISEAGGTLSGKDLDKAKEAVSARATESYTRYRGVDKDTRDTVSKSLDTEIAALEEGSARRLELEGMKAGLGVLSAVEDGDDFEGGPETQQLAKALASTGNVGLLMAVAPQTVSDAHQHQQEIRSALQTVEDKQWLGVLGDDAPGGPIAELLGDDEAGQYLTEDDRAFLREVLGDEVLGGVAVIDPAVTKTAPTSGSGRELMEARGLGGVRDRVRKQVSEALGSEEGVHALSEEGEGERKGFLEMLLDLLTGGRKEMVEAVKAEEPKSKSKTEPKSKSKTEPKAEPKSKTKPKTKPKKNPKPKTLGGTDAVKQLRKLKNTKDVTSLNDVLAQSKSPLYVTGPMTPPDSEIVGFTEGAGGKVYIRYKQKEGGKIVETIADSAKITIKQEDVDKEKSSKSGSLARGYTFEVWGSVHMVEGQKCPSIDR